MQDFTNTALASGYRPVQARDLHPGDVMQEHDWPLHVSAVILSPAAVTIMVTEFEFSLRYAADAEVQVLASSSSVPGRTSR